MTPPATFTLDALAAFYAAGGSAVEVAREALARIATFNDPALFITAVPQGELLERAARWDQTQARLQPHDVLCRRWDAAGARRVRTKAEGGNAGRHRRR